MGAHELHTAPKPIYAVLPMSSRIQSLVTQFVEDLTAAIQAEGASAFAAAIGGHPIGNSRETRPSPKRGAGRRPLRAAPAPRAKPKGAKRAPQEIEAITKTLLSAITKKPGQRIEQIGKVIGVSTKDLALPVAKLFDAKAIKTTGQRRATKYFPK